MLCSAKPEEMQEEMMTKAAAQKRLGACADHVKDMPREDKLAWALEVKNRANSLYLANSFQDAAKLYNDCLVALDLDGTDAENREVQEKLQLPVCTNLAACMIEMNQCHRCIEICDMAIEVDELSAKANYRRGLAHYRLGNHKKARPSFEVALKSIEEKRKDLGTTEIDSDKSLADLKKRVVLYLSNIHTFNRNEKQACKRMFDDEHTGLYEDRPAPLPEEEPIDDSDEALEAAVARARGDWRCCPCRRRLKTKED